MTKTCLDYTTMITCSYTTASKPGEIFVWSSKPELVFTRSTMSMNNLDNRVSATLISKLLEHGASFVQFRAIMEAE